MNKKNMRRIMSITPEGKRAYLQKMCSSIQEKMDISDIKKAHINSLISAKSILIL